MKGLERYLGATYINICQPVITNETLVTLPEPEMPTIIPDTRVEHPNTDGEMTYLKKKNIYKNIRKKLSKRDVYETDMHNIYNLIVGQKNDQLQ